MSPLTLEPQAPRTRRRARLLPEILAAAAAAFLLLLTLWTFGAVRHAVASRSADLVIRAVLREGVTPEQAGTLVEQLQREEPGLGATVVDPDEARARLALQEKWMQNLPEVELADLPTVVELRHPEVLSSPENLAAFLQRLEERPSVQFVQFNSLGYDGLIRFIRAVLAVASQVVVGLVVGQILLYALFAWSRGPRGTSPGRALMGAAPGAAAGGALLYAFVLYGRPADAALPLPGMTAVAGVLAAILGLRVLIAGIRHSLAESRGQRA